MHFYLLSDEFPTTPFWGLAVKKLIPFSSVLFILLLLWCPKATVRFTFSCQCVSYGETCVLSVAHDCTDIWSWNADKSKSSLTPNDQIYTNFGSEYKKVILKVLKSTTNLVKINFSRKFKYLIVEILQTVKLGSSSVDQWQVLVQSQLWRLMRGSEPKPNRFSRSSLRR